VAVRGAAADCVDFSGYTPGNSTQFDFDPLVAALPSTEMAVKRIVDEDVLEAIVEQSGDGYCLIAEILPLFPSRFSHADRRRAVQRAVNRGLVIARRGPDGREHVAVASEGWRQLRARAA
jgi:hypothetical protein